MKLIFLFVLISCLAVLNSTPVRNRDNNFVSLFSTRMIESNENDPTYKSHFDDEDLIALNEKIKHFLPNARKKIEQNKKRKNYKFNNDEVNPQQALKEEGIHYVKNIPISKTKKEYLSEFTKDKLDKVNSTTRLQISEHHFQMDPVFNSNSIRMHPNKIYRRTRYSSSASSLSRSSSEIQNFNDEFHHVWLHKKLHMSEALGRLSNPRRQMVPAITTKGKSKMLEALNQSRAGGDKVNMLAARPWGVPCGDPNQHDMPWGTCMLAVECDANFRIYRGDLFCGRTLFVCCAIQLSTFDNYQGFDVSNYNGNLSSDSEEEEKKELSSKEKEKQKGKQEQKKRREARNRRKKNIKKLIKKITREIKKILDKEYRNGTKQRKNKTKQLQQFIDNMKKQYKKDRNSVYDLHLNDTLHIDSGLTEKMKQMQMINQNFASNATFREAMLQGNMTKQEARVLLQTYPELDDFLQDNPEMDEFLEARRAGGGDAALTIDDDDKYDVEYGYLYY